jgi:hypothetical protein
MGGFQLWANLPAAHKMMDPRYREVKKEEIPLVRLENGVEIRIICGKVEATQGPVQDIVIDPQFLDIFVPRESELVHAVRPGHTAFAYVFEGSGGFGEPGAAPASNGNLILFADGEEVAVKTGAESVRFLMISGKPIGEPIAWRGPIVMNTQEELKTAFDEYRSGTFTKHR